MYTFEKTKKQKRENKRKYKRREIKKKRKGRLCHAAPKSTLRPLYVPYEISIAPLAGVIQLNPFADISRDSAPDAVPATMSGVVYPAE